MQKLIFFLFLMGCFFLNITVAQQMACGTKARRSVTTRGACSNLNNYNKVAIDINNTPAKTINVSVHVFQKSDGTGNLKLYDATNGSVTADYWWLKGGVEANSYMNSQPMNLVSSSPRVQDTKIRIRIVGMYEWKDDIMWAKSENFPDYSKGTDMYNYVISKSSVTHKSNSLHIFLPGKTYTSPPTISNPNPQPASSGIAEDIGSKLWSIIINSNTIRYKNGSANPNFFLNGVIGHEIGHNLGLYHTFNMDDMCDDTPQNVNCFNVNTPTGTSCDQISKVSNNVMDYNYCQCSFTQCQLQRMHNYLLNNIGNLRDIMVETITPTTPAITGPNCASTSGSTYIVSNYQAGTEASWTVTPATSVTVSSGCGQVAVITPKAGVTGSITLKYNILWDNGRVTTASKVMNIQQANATVITGNYSSPTSTTTLNSYNTTALGTTTVRVNLASATSFKWTRTSGNATWTGGSGTYTGSSIDFNLTSTNSSVSFNVQATTPCGIINQSFSFGANSWSFRAAPNPATSTLRISGTQVTQPTARVAEAPLKFELRLYDKYGQIVKYAKNVTGVTDVDIDISGLKPDIYQLQIFKDKELTNQRIEIRR